MALGAVASVSATSSFVLAACGPESLGTARTITLDAAKTRYVSGKESALGLRHKEVILTFDDGPIAGNTPRVLKALADECVKATFFYVGRMARAYPSMVRRVVREGHTLAHHTAAHNRLPEYATEKASKLVALGIRTVEKIAYGASAATPRTPFFRYPYLARNKRTDAVLREQGLIDFNANIDSLDWKRDSPGVVHDRIMRILKREGRGIILMHDIQSRTAKMLPRLLRSLKAGGYKVVHVVPKASEGGPNGTPVVQPDPYVVASVDNPDQERLVSPTAKAHTGDAGIIDMASIDAMANKALAAQRAGEQKSDPAMDTGRRSGVKSPKSVAKQAEEQLKKPLRLVAGQGRAQPASQKGKPTILATAPEPSSLPVNAKPEPASKAVSEQPSDTAKTRQYRARFSAIARRTAFSDHAHTPSDTRSRTASRTASEATPKAQRTAVVAARSARKPVEFNNWKLRPSQWILR